MSQKGLSITVFLIILAAVVITAGVLLWQFFGPLIIEQSVTEGELEEQIREDATLEPEDCIQQFLISDELIKYQEKLDIDGDGNKEIAVLTYNENENPPVPIDCKGYCDEGYVLHLIGLRSEIAQCQELYRVDHTKKELWWGQFVILDLNQDGKDELLFSFSFVKTTHTFLLASTKGNEINAFRVGKGGSIEILDNNQIKEYKRGISGPEWTGCRTAFYEWTGSKIIMLEEIMHDVCP